MKLVFVCGPWSSGTTAVSGMLDALGLDGCGPFFRTNDQRTQNSFESQAFRTVVDTILSEQTLQQNITAEAALTALVNFREALRLKRSSTDSTAAVQIFLKYPLASLLIPLVCKVFDARLIYVLRPLREIEVTRMRRKWAPNFGEKGAQLIYGRMFNILLNHPYPTLVVRYPELLETPLEHARLLADFTGMDQPSQERMQAAATFIRSVKA
jgi:hypothetical protein